MEVPGGFDHEAVATAVGDIANLPVDRSITDQC
jgi:hypothetical protein